MNPEMNAAPWLQHSAGTREHLVGNLRDFDVRAQADPELKRAAVALTVVQEGNHAALIITRRASSLRAHGGQWALPGGGIDNGETPEQAALREVHEEINLVVDESQVLGRLDDFVTRSGYVITPVVVWADNNCADLHPNPDEVAWIEPFTFAELARPDSPTLHAIPESEQPVLSMHFNDDVVFAPTGALLYQFLEVALKGRPTRVLHYEQPLFAWR